MVTPPASFGALLAMLLLLSALSPAAAVALSPSTALDAWRSNRLTRWSRTLDRRFDSEYTAFGRPRTDLRCATLLHAAARVGSGSGSGSVVRVRFRVRVGARVRHAAATAFGRPRTDLRYATTIAAACLSLSPTRPQP